MKKKIDIVLLHHRDTNGRKGFTLQNKPRYSCLEVKNLDWSNAVASLEELGFNVVVCFGGERKVKDFKRMYADSIPCYTFEELVEKGLIFEAIDAQTPFTFMRKPWANPLLLSGDNKEEMKKHGFLRRDKNGNSVLTAYANRVRKAQALIKGNV